MTWSDGPGTIYSDHQHDHDECLWVLGGRMDFTIGGIVYSVGAGDRLRLRRGTVHAARVVGNETCYYLIGQR
jgi:quercetin dioxygenase-like cupin family protein